MSFELISGLISDAVFAAAEAPASTTTPASGQQPQQSPFNFLLLMLPMFVVMWFFMIRPNQKRERERQDMLSKLAKGDRVITSSGIVGTIVGLSEKSVVLRVSEEPPVKLEFMRAAVARVAAQEGESK